MQTIELRAFTNLQKLFKERGWSIPMQVKVPTAGITGLDLAKQLNISIEKIEVMFVNGTCCSLKHLIKPGDRVALVPPGIPSIYRIHLGFYSSDQR